MRYTGLNTEGRLHLWNLLGFLPSKRREHSLSKAWPDNKSEIGYSLSKSSENMDPDIPLFQRIINLY